MALFFLKDRTALLKIADFIVVRKLAEEVSATSEELSAQAISLSSQVGQFRLK